MSAINKVRIFLYATTDEPIGNQRIKESIL